MANSHGAGPTPGGAQTTYAITASTVIKDARGVLFRVSVLVAGTTTGAAYDANTITSPGNQFFTIPATVGTYEIIWPCAVGITIVPGTGQTLAVSWE
ncbi:MAG: hypothetical protein ACYDBI_06100 [Thermoplasmataceae archaeon]